MTILYNPAISNLPTYGGGTVPPIPPEPTPEPKPIFATKFTGITLLDPAITIANFEATYDITGIDSETNFVSPPTGAPIYALSGHGGWGVGHGVHIKSTGAYSFNPANESGIRAKGDAVIIDTTIRGKATKALRMTMKAPGAAVDQTRQMWYMLYRGVASNQPDLSVYTVRFEIKFPSFANMFTYNSGYRGRFGFFDIKTGTPNGAGGDFRYVGEVIQNEPEGGYRFACYADSNANGDGAGYNLKKDFWRFEDTEEEFRVPQNESFTAEFSWIRTLSNTDYDSGRFRYRIRYASDPADTFRTVIDVNKATMDAYIASHPGTTYRNVHSGISPSTNRAKVQRMFHGVYPRMKNVDFPMEIADFRMFDSVL